MHCPFYMVVVCERTGTGVQHTTYEINDEETDVSEKQEVLSAIGKRWFSDDIVSVMVIGNSLEGGPKLVHCWE